MPHDPEPGNLSVFEAVPDIHSGERVYLQELAKFLECQTIFLITYAKKRRLLHFARINAQRPPVYYVTPYGAYLLITYTRAYQGEKLLRGINFRRIRKYAIAYKKRKQQERLAKATSNET